MAFEHAAALASRLHASAHHGDVSASASAGLLLFAVVRGYLNGMIVLTAHKANNGTGNKC
jgi:hypothetical protein